MNEATEPEENRPTPQRLIFESHERAAAERERVSAAPMLPDSVIDTNMAEVEYHAAVLEYFNRLKPHLTKRRHYWDEVPLYNEPLDGKRDELADMLAKYYGVEQHQALAALDWLEDTEHFEGFYPREGATVCGLKNLVHWRDRTETQTVTRKDMIDGKVTETVVKPIHLPKSVAMRVHDALDKAAADLGYNVRPGKDITKSEIDADSGEYSVTGVTHDG